MFATHPEESALEAGLRYVGDSGLSIRRVRRGKSFVYLRENGQPLRTESQLARIRKLVIPPAWSSVRICASPHGYLQAIGWDAKGRKQYRYHPLYREVRDQAKFSRLIAFGTALARIRQSVERDLKLLGLPKEKVTAVVVRLLDLGYMRVGNEQYAKDNESFGLTTMRNRHVKIDGASLMFRYRGKSGQEQRVELTDRRLARVVKQCQDLPGYNLFEYCNSADKICCVDSGDVNRYIRRIAGDGFSAKDFRTWAGTLLAVKAFREIGPVESESAQKKAVVEAVRRVASGLGNRPAVSRKYYIHPAVIEAYTDGSLFQTLEQGEEQNTAYKGLGLSSEEYAVMVIVARYQESLARELKKAS